MWQMKTSRAIVGQRDATLKSNKEAMDAYIQLIFVPIYSISHTAGEISRFVLFFS